MITVLLAAYQGRAYLEQQLDSILTQTVPLRIFVSDDGSDDGTRELLERYSKWYPRQVYLHHRDKSEFSRDMAAMPPAAQNFFWLMSVAAKEEKTDYVMLSDQDDVWFNNKAKTMLCRMRQMESELGKSCPILLHSDMEVVDKNLQQISSSFFRYAKCDPERTSLSEILVENPVTGGAVMMNRALLELAADAPETCCMHDWWLALTASCFGVIDHISEPLYQYRQHGGNALGAKETGSLKDMRARLGRDREVRANYRRMMAQARAFGKKYGKRLSAGQKAVLRAFLSLPHQSPAERFRSIRRNHFYKTSLIQTLAMCITIPKSRSMRRGNCGGKAVQSGKKA